MELLTSDRLPITSRTSGRASLSDRFLGLLNSSDAIRIATGFVSSESVVELQSLIEKNKRPRLDLFIGMHHFSSITRRQHFALSSLNSFLARTRRGCLSVSTVLPFHGKVYGFYRNKRPFAAVIGSSNLDGLFPFHGSYEADILVDQEPLLGSLNALLTRDIPRLATNFQDWVPPPYREEGAPPLSELDGAEKVSDDQVQQIRAQRRPDRLFEIPLKTTPKSNLNVFFGKGRLSRASGIVVPRHWYEVEIIVPSIITSRRGYPTGATFTVITDDGFRFRCKTSGAYSKNLRSENDLRVLGKWIKGRLENSGALNPGEPVTERTFKLYGRNTIALTATNDPHIWYLDFSVEGA
jgi:hypothetical protein